MGDVKVIYLVIPVFWGYLTNAVTSEDTPLITLSDQCSGDINPSILQGVSDVLVTHCVTTVANARIHTSAQWTVEVPGMHTIWVPYQKNRSLDT